MSDQIQISDDIKYNNRINAIRDYYNVSNEAAVFIYFRRKRSYPWRKKSDPKYLYWNAKLQNALLEADSIFDFDWSSLEYGKEEEILSKYGINISTQTNTLYRVPRKESNYRDENGDEWKVVKTKKIDPNVKILQDIGLLPRHIKNF